MTLKPVQTRRSSPAFLALLAAEVTSIMDATEQLTRSRGIEMLALPSNRSTSMGRLSGRMSGAAISLTAGAHDRASDCSTEDCM
jgi:hypothetical protein